RSRRPADRARSAAASRRSDAHLARGAAARATTGPPPRGARAAPRSVEEEPGHARLDLEVDVIGVIAVEVRRERVGEHARLARLAHDGAQLAGRLGHRDGRPRATRALADLPVEMARDAQPATVALLRRAEVDREAGRVPRAGRSPRAVRLALAVGVARGRAPERRARAAGGLLDGGARGLRG